MLYRRSGSFSSLLWNKNALWMNDYNKRGDEMAGQLNDTRSLTFSLWRWVSNRFLLNSGKEEHRGKAYTVISLWRINQGMRHNINWVILMLNRLIIKY